MAGGMHSWGEHMCGEQLRGLHDGGHAWEEKRQLQRAVHILLEAFLLLSRSCIENLFLAAYFIQP